MNDRRREKLEDVQKMIEAAKNLLEEIHCDEVDSRDNIPDNLQQSAQYQANDNACDSLYNAVSSLEEAQNAIEDAVEK